MDRLFQIFVYGLTMSEESEHSLVSGSRFLGTVRTAANYALADLQVYPALVESGDVHVEGELYSVDPQTRFRLDVHYESPILFVRKPIQLEDGATVESYVMPMEQARGKRRIWNGSWKNRFEARPRDGAAMNPFAARARRLRR